MPLLLIAAAASSFACANPAHRDGETIRCDSMERVYALHGIAAPPVANACFRPDDCPVDPGAAARDHLAGLTRGRPVMCTPVTNRGTVRCTASGVDLSCTMIADGLASASGPPMGCKPLPAAAVQTNEVARGVDTWATNPQLRRWLPIFLIVVNFLAYLAFADDKRRTRYGLNRYSPSHLLGLVFFGGGVGAVIAQQQFDHLKDEQPFANQFAILIGLQIGLLVGIFVLP